MSRFLSDEKARIPFSVIGVFLLIGSSITTVYVSRLELDKSQEIAATLGGPEVEIIQRYAQAELARCLNYAAMNAFDEIGKTPVTEISDSVFAIDADGDGMVSPCDVNLNWMRFLTADTLNTMIAQHFQENRFADSTYAVNVISSQYCWQDIIVSEIVPMNMKRTLDHPFLKAGRQTSCYPVYPLLSMNVTLQTQGLQNNTIIMTQKSMISTLITSRFLLLENLTDEFDDRLDGAFGSLGISALTAAMGLTWLRGYLQFAFDKPVNIISSDWIAIITNGGILLEQGIVFNSVDPLGVIYLGYETIKKIAQELGIEFEDDSELDYQTCNPIVSIGMLGDRYKHDAGRIGNETFDVETEFTFHVNISSVCEQELYNLIADTNNFSSLHGIQQSVYSATVELYTDRTLVSDNWLYLLNQYQQQKDISCLNEKTKTEHTIGEHALLLFPPQEGWMIDSVLWQNSTIHSESISATAQYLKSRSFLGEIPFNNTDLSRVVFGGQDWMCQRNKDCSLTWLVRTIWNVSAHRYNNQTNSTEYQTLPATFESSLYSYSCVHVIIDTLVFEFVSRSYAQTSESSNDLANPFQSSIFEGRNDSNLAVVYNPLYPDGQKTTVEYYQASVGFDDAFRDIILLTYDNDYEASFYSDDIKIPKPDDLISQLTPVWLQNQTCSVLKNCSETVSQLLQSPRIVTPETMPDELLQQVVNETFHVFQANRIIWNQQLISQYTIDGRFCSAAAKTMYTSGMAYLDTVESRLREINDQAKNIVKQSTDTALQQHSIPGICYSDIKQTTQQAHSLQIPIPVGATISLDRGKTGHINWCEPARFALLQRPSFLSVQSYRDYHAVTNETYHLKYRNLNIFSPGAGLTDFIEQGFDALNTQVISAIDQGFTKLHEVTNQTIRAQLESTLNTISSELTSIISLTLGDAIRDAQGQGSYLTQMNLLMPSEVKSLVDQVVNTYNDTPALFIHSLNSNMLQDEILDVLENEVAQNALALYGDAIEIISAACEVVKSQVLAVYDTVIFQAIQSTRQTLKNTYNELSEMLEEQIGDAVSSLVGSLIPCGLPLLPPFGWWCTLNVWYIEVCGEIPYFQVIDAQDNTLPHPFWGHTAQHYIRTNAEIWIDVNKNNLLDPLEIIGRNTPVGFEYKTGTFILVPAGKTGVGDRSGGWDEVVSFGYS